MAFIKYIKTSAIKHSASAMMVSVMLACSSNVFAETTYYEEKGSNLIEAKSIFAKYGIDNDLPKLGVSSLVQGEHLVEHVQREIDVDGEKHLSQVFLIKKTDDKGNIDLRIKYDSDNLDNNENVINEIEKSTRIQYRLRNWAQSYDPTSVKAIDKGNGEVEVSFNYSKYGLPQDIAYFRFLSVVIKIVDGQPKNMIITNNKAFKLNAYQVESYRQKITFSTLKSGKLIIHEKYLEMKGRKKNKPAILTETIKPVAFYGNTHEIEILDEERLSQISDPRLHEEKVEVNRVFPLMGDMVRQQGIDLPLPFGLSVTYRKQDMSIPTNDFVIGGVRLNEFFDPNDTFANVTAEALTLRGDVNILPFWNTFGYFGKINVDANVDASYTGEPGQIIKDKLNNKLDGLGDAFCKGVSVLCDKGRLDVPLHLEYDLIGLGTTLSVGYKEFFASLTATYSKTRLEGSDNWGDGLLTAQPMLGYQLVDYRAQLIVGAEYQGLKNRMQGTVITGDIEFDYDVGVDLNSWAYLVGFNKQIGKHYNITVLYNKGETRDSLTLNLGYRF
ncbi:hypothetical protein CW745_09575 [Psychromonas sp. psych-6C06]|uniref:hypothetical protein n=1 Tax=Psychromonas sp. psych-6C06 TaxID=2058089 RepID=UPI000C3302AE|nr:hypothetical protein [Psychromonas sp. psych-6C06]PKF61568.1 hypothetical protein CW745_09575 [Psychromonas sp. psych-6C06]